MAKITTLYQLRKSYAQQTYALRQRYLDAVQGKDWQETTRALINGRLRREIRPQGKTADRLIKIENRARRRRLYASGTGF